MITCDGDDSGVSDVFGIRGCSVLDRIQFGYFSFGIYSLARQIDPNHEALNIFLLGHTSLMPPFDTLWAWVVTWTTLNNL